MKTRPGNEVCFSKEMWKYFYIKFLWNAYLAIMTPPYAQFIFLADDDEDDRLLFMEALHEIAVDIQLTTVTDGEQLMEKLDPQKLPDVVFLDLNMPRKDGFQCLLEIRRNEKLRSLPVIIFSTSFQPDAVERLYDSGAHYYIRKPSNFENFKNLILEAISLMGKRMSDQPHSVARPSKERFVLGPETL